MSNMPWFARRCRYSIDAAPGTRRRSAVAVSLEPCAPYMTSWMADNQRDSRRWL
jgi:hypothetical protein